MRSLGRFLTLAAVGLALLGLSADASIFGSAVRGAASGAAISSLSGGDAGQGAAWGAGIGAIKGAAQQERQQQQQQAAQQQWQQTRAREIQAAYDRGWADAASNRPPSPYVVAVSVPPYDTTFSNDVRVSYERGRQDAMLHAQYQQGIQNGTRVNYQSPTERQQIDAVKY